MVLDAVALQHYMKDLMQGLFGDMMVWQIFHGHTSDVQQLLFNFNLEVSSPIFDTATVAQELEQLARRKGNSFGSYSCGALAVDGLLPTSAACLR